MMKKILISIGIALLLIIAGHTASAGYSDGGSHPAGNCPKDKVCGWLDVRNVYDYGVPYSGSTQNFYNDGATADHICQMKGYDSYTYQATIGQYDKCNSEYSVVWKNSAWSSSKCTSSKWLAQIYCAKAVPNEAPTIAWSINPASVQCNDWYQVEAVGHDNDGNLTAVSVDKDGTPFAYGDGGNGKDNKSGNGTSDDSPKTVVFTAWSQDSTGAKSEIISQTVTIGSCVPQVIKGCTNPLASNYNSKATEDDSSCVLPVNNPGGWLDSATCDAFTGWASDEDSPGTAIDVHFYVDGNFVGATNAGVHRSDVGNHGYSFATPVSLKDNNAHSVSAYGINVGGGNNALLAGSGKTIKCTSVPPIDDAPSGFISAFPIILPLGGGEVTLSWATADASGCTASNAWSGTKNTSGSEVVSIDKASTFNLTCTGPGGTWNGTNFVAVDLHNQAICNDPAANNYKGALPCVYNPPTSSCQDMGANNYGNPLPCTYDTIPGFTITADQNKTQVQFLGSLAGTSSVRTLDINPVGNFTSSVTLKVVSIKDQAGEALPQDTVSIYSFDGKSPSQNATTILNYDSGIEKYRGEKGFIGTTFQVAFSRAVTIPYKVTIQGTSGSLSSTFVLTVDPKATNPNFQEI